MSMGPLGMAGSIATQQSAEQARQTASAQKAESASGVGETEQDEQASDRDADGRRLWEGDDAENSDGNEQSAESEDTPVREKPRSKDPTGMSGGNLDLSG